MIDISHKIKTLREATAIAVLKAHPDTIQRIKEGTIPKGDPLPVAKVAAIQAAEWPTATTKATQWQSLWHLSHNTR